MRAVRLVLEQVDQRVEVALHALLVVLVKDELVAPQLGAVRQLREVDEEAAVVARAAHRHAAIAEVLGRQHRHPHHVVRRVDGGADVELQRLGVEAHCGARARACMRRARQLRDARRGDRCVRTTLRDRVRDARRARLRPSAGALSKPAGS
eukprot:5990655-Prymnesium_polylepis.1